MKSRYLGVIGIVVGLALLVGAANASAAGLAFLDNNPELKAKLLEWERDAPPEVKKEIDILRTSGDAVQKFRLTEA